MGFFTEAEKHVSGYFRSAISTIGFYGNRARHTTLSLLTSLSDLVPNLGLNANGLSLYGVSLESIIPSRLHGFFLLTFVKFAEATDYYFTDPTQKTGYKLSISDNLGRDGHVYPGCVVRNQSATFNDMAKGIIQACAPNITDFTHSGFQMIHSIGTRCKNGPEGLMPLENAEQLFRAVAGKVQDEFETCIKNAMLTSLTPNSPEPLSQNMILGLCIAASIICCCAITSCIIEYKDLINCPSKNRAYGTV